MKAGLTRCLRALEERTVSKGGFTFIMSFYEKSRPWEYLMKNGRGISKDSPERFLTPEEREACLERERQQRR